MSKKGVSKKHSPTKPSSAKFLSTVPYERGFHFFTAVGNYTGITATSLDDFASKLQTIPVESVKFHFKRKDFQEWIRDTIKDEELAERISKIQEGESAEDLRKRILRIVETHTTELRGLSPR
jgi:alpha-amylase